MSILFTDIHNSSYLWNKYNDKMLKMLETHDKLVRKYADKYDGFIVKSIGDSFMIKFDNWDDSILFAIALQKEFPLIVSGHDNIDLRIGIGIGKMYKKHSMIQNCKLVDYYGPVVNIASRMESKVSKIGGFGVYFEDPRMNITDLFDLSDEISVRKIKFMDRCPSEKRKKMLANECRLSSELKGVGGLTAYSVILKLN